MANNPYVNKVVYGNDTVMDISDTTADEDDVVSGKTFYKASGAKGVGRAVIPSTDDCYKTTDDEAYAIGDNDYFPYYSDSLSEKVKISWYNFKSRIKAYFDTIYAQFAGTEAELRDTVGWTGKNLYPLTLDSLKELNTSGTWSDNVYTLNSVSFTVSTNADGYVTAVTTSGTASAQTSFYFISSTVGGISDYLPSGNYIMNGCANGGSVTGSFRMDFDIGTTMNIATDSSDVSFSVPSDSSLLVFWTIGISSGQSMASKTFYPMIRKATIGSNTFEPYHPSVKQTLRDAEVIEGKNLLNVTATTQTINGVTFTVNADGSVKVNGTATANTFLTFPFVLPIGEFILTGCPASGGYGNYLAKITDRQGSAITGIADDTGSGSTFTNSSALDVQYSIRIANGYTASNVVFKPMLRYATEADPTFEPYYIPLKDGKFDRAEQRVLGAKNLLLPDKATSQTVSGVTFTVNADGSIKANGTATAQILFEVSRIYDTIENVILNGCPSGGSTTTYDLRLGGASGTNYIEWGDGVYIEKEAPSGGTYSSVYIVIRNGQVVSNLMFKPMLRLASDPDDTYAPYAMTNKELTDKVQTVYKTATVDSSGMVTFTGVDTSKSYSIEADYGTSWNAPPVTYTKIQISGTTLIYTLSGANNGQTIRLIDKKY